MCDCHKERDPLKEAWLIILCSFVGFPMTLLGVVLLATGAAEKLLPMALTGGGLTIAGLVLLWWFFKLCGYPFANGGIARW